LGSIYGLLHAFLHSKPISIHITSYGVNTALFTGTYLGLRQLNIQLLSSLNNNNQRTNELYASTISSALTGGAATGFVCKYITSKNIIVRNCMK